MPIYEYRCQACEEHFQEIVRTPSERSDDLTCPECGSADVERLIFPPSVVAGDVKSESESEEGAAVSSEDLGRADLSEALRRGQ